MRNILVIIGAFISILLGYAAFEFTGLCDACETSLFSTILGISIISVCLYSYIIGLRSPRFNVLKVTEGSTLPLQKPAFGSSEKRKEMRLPAYQEIEFVLNPDITGKTFKGVLLNTSSSGLCLKLFNSLNEGQKISIKNIQHDKCRTAAVSWVKELEPDIFMAGFRCS